MSLLVKGGFDPRTIADRVGHTDPAFTMQRYSHMFDEQRRSAAVSLDRLLGIEDETAGLAEGAGDDQDKEDTIGAEPDRNGWEQGKTARHTSSAVAVIRL